MLARSLKAVASSSLPKNGSKGTSFSICQFILIPKIVVVAMSGGVDSSVAAKLLAEKVRRTFRMLYV